VIFDTISAATKASSTTLAEDPDTWQIQRAPKPEDIIWENLTVAPSNKVKAILNLTKSSTVFMICVFWSIPVAFINAFSNLATLSQNYPFLSFVDDFSPFWKSVVTGLLPGLLLVILMLVLYPILWNLVKSTRVLTYSELEYVFMRDYYIFLVIDVFFITLLSSSIWDTIGEIIENPKLIFDLLGSSVPAVAIIEIGYILIQSLMVETERIVRIFFLLYSFIFAATSTTEFEKARATEPEMFAYGGNLAFVSLIFTICFCYSTIAPAILPFGVLYFSLNYVIKKYKLLYVHELPFETYGKFFPKVADFMFTGMIIGQLALMGVIGLKFGYWQQLILFPLPLITYLLSSYLHSYYGMELSQSRLPLSTTTNRDLRRSKERVKSYLNEWHMNGCWRQPWTTVDLDDPVKSKNSNPVWESKAFDSSIDIKVSPKENERDPLLSGGSSRDYFNEAL